MRKRIFSAPMARPAAVIALAAAVAVFLYLFAGPRGITKFRPQNRIFTIDETALTHTEEGVRVDMTLKARNLFPWRVRFGDVSFKAMGEADMALGGLEVSPMPFGLGFLEKETLSVSFTVDDGLFDREYAAAYTKDTDAGREMSLQRFIDDIGFIFYSDDIPTGEALCLNWK